MDNCVCVMSHIDTHVLDIYRRAISDSSIYINWFIVIFVAFFEKAYFCYLKTILNNFL